jgi:hypothetical protein
MTASTEVFSWAVCCFCAKDERNGLVPLQKTGKSPAGKVRENTAVAAAGEEAEIPGFGGIFLPDST